MSNKVSRVVWVVFGNVAIVIALLVFVEGLSSYALLIRESARNPLQEMRHHTRYDANLGWVSLPNLDIEDMYGSGSRLRTNTRGFRNAEDFEPARSPGRRRIICSGDSVTFGQGVSDDQTFCNLFGTLDPTLEPINMGQVGYGVDQAYLWYRQEADDLDVDLHILAFITHDILRMKYKEYMNRGRPVLVVRDGKLELTNVPVPEKSQVLSGLSVLTSRIKMLRTAEVAAKIRKRLPLERRQVPGTWTARSDDEVKIVLSALLQELVRFNEERTRSTALVYLPSMKELRDPGDEDLATWLPFAKAQAKALDVPFLDLFEELRDLPAHEASELFLDGYHLSNAGNALVAARLLEELRADSRSGPSLSRGDT
ncbi:MAG: SGNH/GDSL hydrolase family protein [Deltaproteobacteria bacterium]|nr:SGNH/GDSL hydrolase family protein [Deltaproteobacteria bacterium]